MAFRPVNDESGKLRLVRAANAIAFVKGNAVIDDGSGFLTNAAAGTTVDIHYVVAETVTTTAAGQEVLCWATDGVEFEADTDAAWANTDVGTYADLAGAGTINPDASANDLFYIERGIGTAGTDTVVRGRFARGTPNA